MRVHFVRDFHFHYICVAMEMKKSNGMGIQKKLHENSEQSEWSSFCTDERTNERTNECVNIGINRRPEYSKMRANTSIFFAILSPVSYIVIHQRTLRFQSMLLHF